MTDRQTVSQTDRLRQTTDKDKQTVRQTSTQAARDRQTDSQSDRQAGRQAIRDRQTKTNNRQRQTDRKTERHTNGHMLRNFTAFITKSFFSTDQISIRFRVVAPIKPKPSLEHDFHINEEKSADSWQQRPMSNLLLHFRLLFD